jgi:hypothetical protein
MTSNSKLQTISQILNDETLVADLAAEEAIVLVDWARAELDDSSETSGEGGEVRAARVRTIMKEIDELVGNRQSLVADDLEERMIALLVGHLDPKSQTCLEISRDIAQVTAEKDHLEGAELVRRLTSVSSKTRRLIAGAVPPAGTTAASSNAAPGSATVGTELHAAPAMARARPIPRPTIIEPPKPGLRWRLFGRK